MDETEGLIDLVRTDGASDVAAVLKEQPDGGYKVSLVVQGRHRRRQGGPPASAARPSTPPATRPTWTPRRPWRPWSPS